MIRTPEVEEEEDNPVQTVHIPLSTYAEINEEIIITRRLLRGTANGWMDGWSRGSESVIVSVGTAPPCHPITRANCCTICRLLNLSQP